MNEAVITSLDQVTAAWLTDVLAHSGALTRGAVDTFQFAAGQGNWSTSARLAVQYAAQAEGSLPGQLFLKMVDTDIGDGESFDDSEVLYYTRDYRDVPDAPLLRCYHAAYARERGRYHLLLQDVTDTHIQSADKEPTLAYGLALAEGLASLHARWWGAERLAQAGSVVHDEHHIQRFVNIAAPGVEPILERFSGQLKPSWPGMIREIFDQHPRAMIRRAQDLNGFTLIHGDAGSANVLVPRQGDRPIYLIDRQPFNWSLTTWLGAYDLAYAMVLDWSTDIRRQLELPVLRHYHQHLIQNGVSDYSWDQLYADYQLCVVMCVYIAVEYCRGGINERWTHVWLLMLQQSLTAIDDLDCRSAWQADR